MGKRGYPVDTDGMNWGRAIRIARTAREFTQADLAALIDLDTSYISLIENNKRTPSVQVLEWIGEITGFPVPLLSIMASPQEAFANLDDKTRSIMGGWFFSALIGKTLEL